MGYVVKYYRLADRFIVTNIFNRGTMLLPPGDYSLVKVEDIIKLNNAMLDENVVTIRNTEKLKDGEILEFDDFDVEVLQPLEKAKKVYRNKINEEAGVNTAIISSLDMFEYLDLFSRFASKGIFITETNQEEKYLEILATGEDDFINDLEQFLNIKDRLYRIQTMHKKMRKAIVDLSEAESEEDAEKVYNNYKGYNR